MTEDLSSSMGGSRLVHLSDAHDEALNAHRESHLGPAPNVLHEMVSEVVHLDLWPHLERPGKGVTLVTQGASALAMEDVPDGYPDRFELLTYVHPDFLDTRTSGFDEGSWWPARMLKEVGRFPFHVGTGIGIGHTLAFSDPPEPLVPGSLLTSVLLLPPAEPEEFRETVVGGATVAYFWAMPITSAELEFKLERGTDALLEAFDEAGVPMVCWAERPCAVSRRKRRFFRR